MNNKLKKESTYFIGDFKIFLCVDGGLKVTAIDDKRSDIRIEPISANNIKIHSH
jgi:hypothetical protein